LNLFFMVEIIIQQKKERKKAIKKEKVNSSKHEC